MKKIASLCLALVTSYACADEGMWQPHQLPNIATKLQAAGLKLNPNDLTELTEFVEFEHQLPSAQQILIDDFSLIEWQTPFSNKPPLLISVDDKQASYIGFEKPYQGSVTLTYH